MTEPALDDDRSDHSIIRDPLYGEFVLPPWLEELVSCWELTRLRGVRLINVNSLFYASLGEATRYTHTLGALRLARRYLQGHPELDDRTGRLLSCALALHDIGTPAFGHSLEYVFRRLSKLDHVDVAAAAIRGRPVERHALRWPVIPDAAPHGELRRILASVLGKGFEDDLIDAIYGRGPIGFLVSSTSLDIDNIDNVFRMADAMGITGWPRESPQRLAGALCQTSAGTTVDGTRSNIERLEQDVIAWQTARMDAYRLLNLNAQNLAALAMLRELVERYVQLNPYNDGAWWTTDSHLVGSLTHEAVLELNHRLLRGDLYATIGILWFDLSAPGMSALAGLTDCFSLVATRIGERLKARIIGYALRDRGTFARPIPFKDATALRSIGSLSDSVVLSLHAEAESSSTPRDAVLTTAIEVLSRWFAISQETLTTSLLHLPVARRKGSS